jgi:hypothetical protein
MSDTANTAPAGVPLELSDISNAVQIIDFAADQGAFKGWKTIEQVLGVRQRLNAFLTQAAAAQAADAADAAEAAEAPADATQDA